MDVGSVLSNALGGVLGGLVLLVLVNVSKHVYTKRKQRTRQPRQVIDKALRETKEYKELVADRRFYRISGYMFTVWASAMLGYYFATALSTKKFDLPIVFAIFMALLISVVPMQLYLGYLPISSQEVEQKRRQSREKTFKLARGARPYGYILWYIVNPLFWGGVSAFYFIGLTLFFAYPAPVHLPVLWSTLGIIFSPLIGSVFTSFFWKRAYFSIKYLKYYSAEMQQELREQFKQDEFKQ
ncbi:MAG: hypothetical protein NVSMB27_13800 [Ktedonobacteraceae bacterium]